MSQPIALPLFISVSATERRRSAGSKKVIKIEPALTLAVLKLSPFSTRSVAIHVSKRSSQRFSHRRTGRRRESEDLLRRTEAAQRLQGCDCLRRCGLATHAGRQPDFSVLRNSKLGCAACRAPAN